MMKRSLAFVAGVGLLLLLLSVGMASAAPQPPNIPPPPFDANNFHDPTRIDNPYMPLVPGAVFTYRSTKHKPPELNVVEVTRATKRILGVNCVVVRDTVTVNGELLEDTLDWYAQDDAGNVWYMGEDTKEYENGVVVSTAGSWEAGVDGAQPGYVMEAHPQVGDVYRQEYYAGEAEDMAEVLSLTASASVHYGSWQGNVLQTRETSPLEPTVAEEKFYAPGVGLVRIDTVKGGSAESELLTVTHR